MFRKTLLALTAAAGLLVSVGPSTPFLGAAHAAPGRYSPPGPRQLEWEIIGTHPHDAPIGRAAVVDYIYGSELDAQNLLAWWQANGREGWTYAYRKAK